ncbi:hypothetical protein AMP9_4056 [plant metagenome]|uniref:Peptidase A2 domain-containing protein n=1 Tax=plant metagenome TaxID=1297885 RepID=A0A484PAF3_9ZZZZ
MALMQASSVAELRHDDRGRPVIGAQLNGSGPYDMVVDTAAQSSLISQGLVHELSLTALDGEMTIRGAVDAQTSRLYPIDRFSTPLFQDENIAMLALPNANTTSARGIIGMEYFQQSRLLFDREHATLSVGSSGPAPEGFVTVAGQLGGDGLLTIPVALNGSNAPALVDSGAGPTVANLQVLATLDWTIDDACLKPAGGIQGATQGATQAWIAKIDTLSIGSVTMHDVPIVFSNFTGSSDQPSLILGSDLLNLLPAYAVDFPRAELQIRLPSKRDAP